MYFLFLILYQIVQDFHSLIFNIDIPFYDLNHLLLYSIAYSQSSTQAGYKSAKI